MMDMPVAHDTNNEASNRAKVAGEHIRDNAEKAQDAMRSGLNSASESTQRFTDQVTQAYGITGEGREELTRQGAQSLEMITQASTMMLTRGVQDLSREWFSLTQERLQKNVEDLSVLARCQSIPDFMAAQSNIMRHNLEQTIEGTRRIAEVATRVANEAGQTLKAESKKTGRAA
jgi:phasin family protein